MRAEIDRVAHVFWLGKNLAHHMACPVIERTELFLAFPYAAILPRQIDGRSFHLVIKQDAGDLIGASAFNCELEDAADNRGHFLIDHTIPAGTVKIDAGIAVVRVMDAVGEALLCSVGFEVSFLIGNGTAVPDDVVVAGESFVQGSDLSFSLGCGHVRRSFQTADSFVVQSL